MSKTHVPLDQVRDNPHQVRIGTGDLGNLAQSVLAHGLRQLPEARLLVEGEHWTGSYSQHTKQVDGEWRLTDGVAELASGHRRAAAVQLLNDDDVVSKAQLTSMGLVPGYLPVDLQRLSDEEMLDVGTAENLDRQDLSSIEEARLIQEHVSAGRSLSAIAPHFGDRSESWVSNRKRLLQLPTYVQEHVHEGDLTVREGQALIKAFALKSEHEEAYQKLQRTEIKPGNICEAAVHDEIDSKGARHRTEELENVLGRIERATRKAAGVDEGEIAQPEVGTTHPDTPDSDTENDGDRPELPEGWKWEELPNGLPKAVGPNDEESSAQYDWEAVAARARATYAENHRPEEVEVLLEKCSNGDARMEDLVLSHEHMMISDRKYEALRDAFDRTDEEWATLSKCWEKYSYVQHSPSDLLSKAIRHERGEMEGQHTQWGAELLEEHVGSALEKSVYYSEQPDTRESADESYDSDRDCTEASASDGGSDAGAREKGDTDTSRDDAREKSTDGTSQGHETKSERPSGAAEGEQPTVSGEVSGDGAPRYLSGLIDAVERDGCDWKLQSLDEGHYQGTVQNGGKAHIAEGSTPAEALQGAYDAATGVPADKIGSVNESDVDRLLSADGTEMWDDQAAEEASIASLLVAHRVAGERQETWRTKLIAEAVQERAGRVDRDDVPEDVLEEVQAEVERRLEPVEA